MKLTILVFVCSITNPICNSDTARVYQVLVAPPGVIVCPQMTIWVIEGSRVMTDDARVFQHMHKEGFIHESVNHAEKEYVRGEAHTNNIEAFWSNLKRGIQGTYISVSKKHLQKYLWEFEYRHNLCHAPHLMLPCLMVGFAKSARRA